MLPIDLTAIKRDRAADAAGSVRAAGARLEYSARSLGKGAGGLRDLHLVQLGAILFLAPNALVALGFGAWACGGVLLGCALALFVLLRIRPRDQTALLAAPIDFRALSGCAALALTLCLLGGEAHLFYANFDWLIRDAVLSDLVGRGFPIFYRYEDQDYILRAPLGMYMAPAAIGWGFGLKAAHVALLVQNSVLLACCLYFVTRLTRAAKLPFIACFLAFSGMDIVPCVFIALEDYSRTGVFVLQHTMMWNSFFSYWGHIPQIFWAPNHALPAWWFALLVLLHEREEIDAAALAASFATLLFWSPLAMMGAAPFLAMCALRGGWREWLQPRFLLAASGALGFIPVALYLVFDSGAAPHEWLIWKDGFWSHYALLIAIGIPHVAVVAAAWSRIDGRYRSVSVLAIGLLLLIPVYAVGDGNDFAMRASIVPLFILAYDFCDIVPSVLTASKALIRAPLVIILLSAYTGFLEIKRGLTTSAFAISDCGLPTATRKLYPGYLPAHYLARKDGAPSWMAPREHPPSQGEDRMCWPDHPMLRDDQK